MGLDLEVEDEAAVFSARSIRAHLRAEPRPVVAFKNTLAWGSQRLYSLFHDSAAAESLVRARAFLVDEILREAWARFFAEPAPGIALIAVGGYGRGELLPHSDVDVLVLTTPSSLQSQRPALEQFLQLLWDIGLEVGSSVRTVEECLKLATVDLTVITNLMESRLLTGDAPLFTRLQQGLAPERMWPTDTFYKAKLEEQAQRHRKFDDTGYKLEPNVKESPGGLRDIQTIAWVAQRHFGTRTLNELKDRGFLTATECAELYAGQDFLWRVRFALHMLTGRHEDRLLFDHQVRLAALFGYDRSAVDADRNQAVEQFMQLYYRTIKSLSCLNDMLLQLFDEALLRSSAQEAPRALNAHFQARGNFIEAIHGNVFRRHPHALIEIFRLLQEHPELRGIRADTLRLIRRDRKLVDDALRDDLKAKTLFMDLFREGRGLTRALRRMNRYGVLGRYLPAFGLVIGHMQYDLFDTLTVDEHILYVVRNLRRFAMERFRDELPFCSEVMGRLPKKELLYLAGLFHDLAKGRGGDHSELGAAEGRQFCLDHGLSHADADLVAWLVRHHLLMSLTAQKQDVSDPEIVLGFARKVETRTRLDYLFLLTCADIRATNPALWNGWRESLLNALYRSASEAFDGGLQRPLNQDQRVQEQKQRALAQTVGMDRATAERIWKRFEDDYFLRHTPQELAWHLPAITRVTESALPLILARNLPGASTAMFLYTRDRDHLFGLTTGVLAQLGLNILDARLHTTDDGYVLDSYAVVEENGAELEPVRIEEIQTALRRVISNPEISVVDVNRRTSRRLKHFNTPTTVFFSIDESRGRTRLELVAADQPGLLSLVGRIFQKRGILLDAAKIATLGERAEDVFFITDKQHRPLTDPALLDELREVLTRTLDRSTDTPMKAAA